MTLELQNSERKRVRDCETKNSRHTLFLTDHIERATGGSLPFRPANTAGQSTERRFWSNPAWLEESHLAHVAVFPFVRPNCVPGLWPQDSVNGSAVITG